MPIRGPVWAPIDSVSPSRKWIHKKNNKMLQPLRGSLLDAISQPQHKSGLPQFDQESALLAKGQHIPCTRRIWPD